MRYISLALSVAVLGLITLAVFSGPGGDALYLV